MYVAVSLIEDIQCSVQTSDHGNSVLHGYMEV